MLEGDETEGRAFGELLHRHRLARGHTQEELAERAGLSARAIGDLERGRRRRPQLYTVRQLAAAVELGIEDQARFEGVARAGQSRAPLPAARLPVGNFLGAVSASRLVGRRAELERLEGALRAVTTGGGRCVFVAGEPGAGKTRLMQEVMLRLQEHDVVLGTGRCYEGSREIPYYPFLEALPMVLSAAPAFVRDDVRQRWPYLGPLLPEQAASAPVPRLEGPQD
jgi:transcriptional regulator with XRE-family HTH domain